MILTIYIKLTEKKKMILFLSHYFILFYLFFIFVCLSRKYNQSSSLEISKHPKQAIPQFYFVFDKEIIKQIASVIFLFKI